MTFPFFRPSTAAKSIYVSYDAPCDVLFDASCDVSSDESCHLGVQLFVFNHLLIDMFMMCYCGYSDVVTHGQGCVNVWYKVVLL